MSLASALRSGVRIPLRCPWTVLPFYLLATGTLVVARVPLLAGLALVLTLLRTQGRIEPVVRAFDGFDPNQVDPSDPTTLPSGLTEALDGLVTPTVVAVLGVALFATLVVGLVVQAVASAGTFSAVYAALDGRDPLTDGIRGLVGHWQTFVGLSLLRVGLLAVAIGLVAAGVAVGVTLGGPLGVVAGVLVGLAGLVTAVGVSLALSFVGPAVVVDEVGVAGSVRGSLGFIRRNPVEFLLFVVVTVGVSLAVGAAAGVANLLGVPRLVGVVTPLVVAPVLGGFQTALYADVELPSREIGSPYRRRFGGGLARGWRALRRFVGGHPLAVVGAAALLTVGIVAGWAFTAPFGVTLQPPEDVAGVFGTFAVGPFVNIAANNWLVATGGSYGGLALGVPTASELLFNGALIGALAGVFDRVGFLALVAPHGVVELPALAVSGGLGLHLGRVGLDGLRGRLSAQEVGEELGGAFEVLVGLALVFVVAAFVEAFLTPQIAALVLGG
ncbi:Stage II sporulation protein M [Halogranum amylolyticum]|uniref:Stage II sporulation protein M n=1 Tax=Halogranum amylolyticum TaxID=660520 RepID=A0A1H8R345_9EURY|nr:stage II sporulation protein M [Halogranum amylolyticum]SEO60598.1 Stage II sporulation protein M [Halogranum amylolyticum]